MTEEIFMTTEQFAKLLGISVKTVYSYIYYKQLPHQIYRTLGRKLIFIRQSVIDWVLDGANLKEKVKK